MTSALYPMIYDLCAESHDALFPMILSAALYAVISDLGNVYQTISELCIVFPTISDIYLKNWNIR
jgi:hypothetical protein